METSNNISSARNNSNIGLRSVLALVGIAIAIICSLVSLKDLHSSERSESHASRSTEPAKFMKADVLAKAMSVLVTFTDRIN
jgi:hypothetical protein